MKSLAYLTVVSTILLLVISQSQAVPQLRQVGQRWPANQQVSMDQVDHRPFTQLLGKYVNTDGEVNYAGWKNSSTDRSALQNYLKSLSQANPNTQASRQAILAFWINAYNAVTLEGMLEVYPTSSIRKHTNKLGYNVWTDLKLQVGEQQINLEDIEHKVLRKMNEPRIHFAIVCASVGCPRLLNEAYTAQKLEQQLVVNTKDFFSRQRNLTAANGQIGLSTIMKWFGSDFGPDQNSQLRAVGKYFPQSAQEVLRRGGFSVRYLDYDWNLNEQRRK